MTLLSYDRYCDEIVIQTDLLNSCLKDADLAVSVPSCPGWSAGRLVRHLGDVHRWAETTVRTRATGPLLVEHSRGLPSEKVDDPAIKKLVALYQNSDAVKAAIAKGFGDNSKLYALSWINDAH